MKITDIRLTPVAFRDPPLRNSTGVHQPYALRTIIQVFADNGVQGVGETYGGERMLAELQAVSPALMGEDPRLLNRLRARVPAPRVFSGFEVACLDLAGKSEGRRVCDLLGGALREHVPYSAYLFYKFEGDDDWGEVLTPDSMVGEAQRFVRDYGFRALKVKGGVLPPDEEIETMRLLRQEFGPDARLRIDPNCIWTVETSIRVGKALGEIGLEYLEDPTPGQDGMATVRREVPMPLATNSCVVRVDQVRDGILCGCVDVILSDHHYWGGLVATQHLAALCGAVGWEVSMHSNSHLGISLAAMTHVAATLPNLEHECDTHYPWQTEDVIAGERLKIENGGVDVPRGPGLGVELDEAKLAAMHETYQRCGIRGRDDVTEMRRYVPDWQPLSPRW